jgi:hypothetical protein
LSHFNQNRNEAIYFSKKITNIKFHENPPGGKRTVLCRQVDGQTDTTSLMVVFRNCFGKTRNNLQDDNEKRVGKKLKTERGTFYEELPSLERLTDEVMKN